MNKNKWPAFVEGGSRFGSLLEPYGDHEPVVKPVGHVCIAIEAIRVVVEDHAFAFDTMIDRAGDRTPDQPQLLYVAPEGPGDSKFDPETDVVPALP